MSRGHFSVSWGPSGGFYFIRERSATRLCLWRIAFTYLPGLEVDDLMRCLVSHDSYRERALAAEALVRAKDEAIGELLSLVGDSLEQRAARRVERYGLEGDDQSWNPADLIDDVSDLGWA